MTLKESIDLESTRKPNEMILIKDNSNDGWWRAYEESAYLCEFFVKDMNTRLKPVKKYLKELEKEYICVGFPIKSVDKYIPGVIENKKAIFNDDMTVCRVDVSDRSHLDVSKFEEWKKSVSKTKSSNNKKQSYDNKTETDNQSRYVKMIMLAQEIIGYPIEEKSMIDNISFISGLKKKFINIL